MKTYARAAVVALIALVAAACGAVDPETVTQTDSFRVSPGYRLDLSTFNGSIKVAAGSSGRVEIVATIKSPDDLSYVVALDSDTVRAVAEDSGWNWFSNRGVSLEVTAPPDAVIDLDSSNGSIEVAGVGTRGTLDTSNGKIALSDVVGEFDLHTSNGSITIEDVEGEFDADTSNGSIRFSGTLSAGSDNRLKTSNGSITAELGPNANVRVDAETSNGDVDVDFPLDNATINDDRVLGNIGDGDADLELRTSNGDINIR